MFLDVERFTGTAMTLYSSPTLWGISHVVSLTEKQDDRLLVQNLKKN